MSKREVVFWDEEGKEQLSFTEKDEAIEYILDGSDELPETLEICGFARIEVTETPDQLSDIILEDLFERLDENYGGENPTDISAEIQDKAEEFAKFILDKYEPRQCEIIKRETINVNDWVIKNRPDWID